MNARQRRYRQWKLLKALVAESIAIDRTIGELTQLMAGALEVAGKLRAVGPGQGTNATQGTNVTGAGR